MSDEKFEEFLQREAAQYNAPPPTVPRDEMWQVIAAARAKTPQAGIVPMRAGRPRMRYTPWIGMAAALMLGVGIGRFVRSDSTPAVVATTSASDARASAAAAAPVGGTAQAPTTPTSTTPETTLDAAATQQAAAPRPGPRQPTARLASTSTEPATAMNAADGSIGSIGSNVADGSEAFQVASREHLLRAEALVTIVASTPRDAVMDSLMGQWSREMLSNTRLLLDSPAGDDPVRRRLLEDLETLLVQLVQRSGGAVNERELINRTIDRTQLLTRLRATAVGI